MPDLTARFERAVADSKRLPERPDNATLLKIYALFKQASTGDAAGGRPGPAEFIGRAKWDAWDELRGTPASEAMRSYAVLIESLKSS